MLNPKNIWQASPGNSFDRNVVRFGRAGREDDFFRVGPDQVGHLGAGLFDGGLGLPPEGVGAAVRVAVVNCSQETNIKRYSCSYSHHLY